MTMLRLLLGTDYVALRDAVLHQIGQDIENGLGNRIFMVPELISHDMERRLCYVAGDTASRYAQVLSFTQLARRVAEGMGNAAMECLDNGGRVVAMAAAARSLSGRLKAYASVETRPEFLIQMVDAADEFKRCCITAGDLLAASQEAEGNLGQKLEELGLLLSGYDSLCARGKRDPRDQMTWLLEQLEDSDFGAQHVLYIDGFPDFTRQHMEILAHLIRTSALVTVSLNCDNIDTEQLAFEKAGQTAAALYRCAREAGVAVQVEHVTGREDPLAQVCEALFQGDGPENVEQLQVFCAESVWDEVHHAAQQVLELVRGGCRYRDIAIVCCNQAAYENALKLVFHRCKIPLYMSGTEDILSKTVVNTVLAAMDAALGGFEQTDVVRYIKSQLSGIGPDDGDILENYAILWGIRGSKWLQPWTQHPNGLGEPWNDWATARLEKINRLREQVMGPLEKLRDGVRKAVNLREQVQALYTFLSAIRLDDRLRVLAQKMQEDGNPRDAQILNQLWEILLGATQQMHDVLGETVWEPEYFTRLFILLLGQYDVGTIPPVLDAVTAGPVTAMRCQQCAHLIVLGAQEGALPTYGGSAGLLTDSERDALRALGVPLTGGALDGLKTQFSEIYGVFCGARQSVRVSYSGGQSSFVYRRLQRMTRQEQRIASGFEATQTSPWELGAYLARWGAEDMAQALGVYTEYKQAAEHIAYTPGNVQQEQIRGIYGERLNLSASQIDRQAQCRMSYFLKYGLRAKERKEAAVDPAEFGTYVHAVLENTASDVMDRGGFARVSLEETMEIAMQHADDYAAERFGQLDSARIGYLFRRNRAELQSVVAELWEELKDSDFLPAFFELGFGEDQAMDAIAVPAKKMQAVLRGFVDRVDIWRQDGRSYFRVVDYKTGKKDFDYCDVFNGVGLQMLLYMFALEQAGADVLQGRSFAAGVQYFPARMPYLSADGMPTQEQAAKLRKPELRRKGLVLADTDVIQAMEPNDPLIRTNCTRKKDGTLTGDVADREQFRLLRQYVFALLGNMVDDIASGNVTPNPYTRGTSHSACTYCPYDTVCHAGSVSGRRNYKAMTPNRFWEEVAKEVHHGGTTDETTSAGGL